MFFIINPSSFYTGKKIGLVYGTQFPHRDCTTSANKTPFFLLFPLDGVNLL